MTQTGLKLLLDEMHSPIIAAALAEAGWDVIAVSAEPSLRSASDAELLDHAATVGRVLVTENIRDYMPLVKGRAVEGETRPGLILTNPKRFNRTSLAYPGNVIAALQALLEAPPTQGQSWIWWL